MTENRRKIKVMSKYSLKQMPRGKSIAVAFVFMLLVVAFVCLGMKVKQKDESNQYKRTQFKNYFNYISEKYSPEFEKLLEEYDQEEFMTIILEVTESYSDELESIIDSVETPGMTATSIYLLISLMLLMINVGYKWHGYKVAKYEKNGLGDLFEVFTIGEFLRVFFLMFIESLIILCTVFFPLVGVYFCIQYSQTVYLLHDNPDKNLLQCMKESRAMMKGHIWEYIVLDLSQIAWYIAGICCIILCEQFVFYAIGTYIFTKTALIIIAVFAIVSLIIYLLKYPEVCVTHGNFHRLLAGDIPPVAGTENRYKKEQTN